MTPAHAQKMPYETISDDMPQQGANIQKAPIVSIMDTMVRLMGMYQIVKPTDLLAPALRTDILEQLRIGRFNLLKYLLEGSPSVAMLALGHGLLRNQYAIRTIGLLYLPLEPAEADIISRIRSDLSQGARSPFFINMLAIAHLYCQPFDVPFVTDGLHDISKDSDVVQHYLSFFMYEAMSVMPEDDIKIANNLLRIINWTVEQLESVTGGTITERTRWVASTILSNIGGLTVNQMVFSVYNSLQVAKARGRLIHAFNRFHEFAYGYTVSPFTRKAKPAKGRKIRVGYLIRSLGQGADTQVILAEIGNYDSEKVEVYIYSRDVQDNSFQHNVAFYRRFYAKVTEVRTVAHRPVKEVVEKIRKDELDMFIAHDATSYACGLFDQISAYRVAPVQVYLNRLMSISSGLDSFDFYAAARTPDAITPLLSEQTTEKVRSVPGTTIAYDKFAQVPPSRVITRDMLGVKDDEILLLCGSAASKIVPACCDLFVRVLKELPQAKLVMAAFNPAWGGMMAQQLLETRLSIALKKHGVSRDRIVMIAELAPQDVPQLTELANLYLTQWPLGGATWMVKCLNSALPLIVMESPLLNGIGDPSLVRGAGFEELIAKDAEDYVRLAVDLANNKEKRADLRQRMKAAKEKMPHNDIVTFSKQMQDFYIGLVDETAVHDQASA